MRMRALGNSLSLCLALVLHGCDRGEKAEPDAQHYHARGIVRGLAPDHSTIEIEHEAIAGFMPAMTMPFTARDAKEIANLRRGDAVEFRLDVYGKDGWITEVKKINPADVHLPAITPPSTLASAPQRLREGDAVPDFQLTNESGERITQQSFRGKPWIVTFIFTRCPIPNFCPRMTDNFSELQKAIQTEGIAKARLLSITLDPEYDTPAILKAYAEAEGADPQIWNFATGTPAAIEELTRSFAVYRLTEGGTINHGLTTALIDEHGMIAKLWRGNSWKVEEVVDALGVKKVSPENMETSPE